MVFQIAGDGDFVHGESNLAILYPEADWRRVNSHR
jgi:hypothetical protein